MLIMVNKSYLLIKRAFLNNAYFKIILSLNKSVQYLGVMERK